MFVKFHIVDDCVISDEFSCTFMYALHGVISLTAVGN